MLLAACGTDTVTGFYADVTPIDPDAGGDAFDPDLGSGGDAVPGDDATGPGDDATGPGDDGGAIDAGPGPGDDATTGSDETVEDGGGVAFELCGNRVDDDGNGAVDCDDPACADDDACNATVFELCGNRVDDDGDGAVDCADDECADDEACDSTATEICDNRVDDDRNGRVDCADPACADDEACDVARTENCTNGADDDGNRLTDCLDPACFSDPACRRPPGREMNCDNAIDDDGDGAVDCGDTDCAANPDCAPEDACTAADIRILATIDAGEVVGNCAIGCIGGSTATCAAGCVRDETGISEPCSVCFGNVTACTLTRCITSCIAGPDSDGCRRCVDAQCGDAFEECSGVPLDL